MAYLDDKMKLLLKKQTDIGKESTKVSFKRQAIHEAISNTLAKAILKGSFLSQEIWTIPENWVANSDRNDFSLTMRTTPKGLTKKWGNVGEYVRDYCYRVCLVPGIHLTYQEDALELTADSYIALAEFVKKQGIEVVCADANEIIEDLENKIKFIKKVKSQLKIA